MRTRGIRVLPGGDYGFPSSARHYARESLDLRKILGFSGHGYAGRATAWAAISCAGRASSRH